MAANQNDYFKKTGANTVTTLAAPGKALAASSITVGSTANYPTDTGITIGIRQVDSDGVLVAGTYTEWKATVTSGTTLAISTTPELGSDQVYPAGSTTQVFIPVSSSAHNDLIDGVLEFANQDGTLQTAPVQAALGVTTLPSGGWDILNSGTAPTVSSGYNKGNREYDLTFAGVDLSSTLSPGMRIKVDRGTTPPTQCTDLESGSSQFWQDTSVSGLSFTDDFTCEAWIKLESYTGSAQAIVTRFNGSSGFQFLVMSDGTIRLQGSNGGGANISNVNSYQSIPTGRWVHVAAKLDMSTFTYSNTTSQIYIDGVEVPGLVARGGTNPTAIVQAGNLEVGSQNGGGSYFDGKITDVRIWSALRTTTQIRDNMNQQLVGNESNLVSYYKFNGDGNDSTSNANNLTAQGSANATSTDNPMNATEYALITKVVFSTNTTVTVFTGTDNNIPNMTLSNPYYSTQARPFGWPLSFSYSYYVPVMATQSSLNTLVDIYGATTTITVPEGACLEIYYRGNLQSSVAADVSSMRLYEDSVNIHLTFTVHRNANNQENLSGMAIVYPTAGSHTYKLMAQRDAGTGNLTNPASTGVPTVLYIRVRE